MIFSSPVTSENFAPLNSTVQDSFFNSRLELVVLIVEKEDILSRITHAIQKKYQSKLRYRSSVFRRSFIEKRVRQALRSSIHLNVVELKARDFNCAARFKSFELFNFIIAQINVFFDHVRLKDNPVLYSPFDLRIKLKNFYSYVKNQPRNYY